MPDLDLRSELLDHAARARVSLSPLAERHGLTLADAYAIQGRVVARRVARGARIVGLKMGFTSEAMRRQMNVSEPNIGWLTSDMALASGELTVGDFIHPRLEPEVAVVLGRDLETDDPVRVVEAVEAFAPAIEVVDSRFHDYKFQGLDNVADNSSSAAFVLGPWRKPAIDVGALMVRLAIGGSLMEAGESSAVMGHPLKALGEGARIAAGLGRPLKAGMIVLTGGVTRAYPITAGQGARAEIAGLGNVVLRVR